MHQDPTSCNRHADGQLHLQKSQVHVLQEEWSQPCLQSCVASWGLVDSMQEQGASAWGNWQLGVLGLHNASIA